MASKQVTAGNEVVQKLKKVTAKKRRAAPSKQKMGTFITESGTKVFLDRNYTEINPVLSYIDDEMVIGIPLPKETPIFDRKNNIVGIKVVLDNFFISSQKKIINAEESYFLNKNLIAKIPTSLLEQRWSAPSIQDFINGSVDYTPWEVYKEIKENAWDHFMDFGDNKSASVFSALYDILTYCYPLFNSMPYVRFTGNKGAAKSKGGAIHDQIGFNSLSAVNLTAATMFRSIQDTSGMLIIDEAETYGKRSVKSETQEGLDQVINSGWQKNGKVPRLEKTEKGYRRVLYSTYSPKVICGIGVLTETLRDRSYEILLVKTLDRIKSARTVDPRDKRWQQIRDMAYVMILNHWKEIRDIMENEGIENRLNLMGRDWDKAYPILVLASFVSRHAGEEGQAIIDQIWEFLEDQREKEEEQQLDSIDSNIIETLDEVVNEKHKDMLDYRQIGKEALEVTEVEVKLIDISEKVALLQGIDVSSSKFNKSKYSKYVKDKIQKMGLARNFKRGTAGFTVFNTTSKSIMEAKIRYKLIRIEEIENTNEKNEDSNNGPDIPEVKNSIELLREKESDSPNGTTLILKDPEKNNNRGIARKGSKAEDPPVNSSKTPTTFLYFKQTKQYPDGLFDRMNLRVEDRFTLEGKIFYRIPWPQEISREHALEWSDFTLGNSCSEKEFNTYKTYKKSSYKFLKIEPLEDIEIAGVYKNYELKKGAAEEVEEPTAGILIKQNRARLIESEGEKGL